MTGVGFLVAAAGLLVAARSAQLLLGHGRPKRGPRPTFVIAGPYLRVRNPLLGGLVVGCAGLRSPCGPRDSPSSPRPAPASLICGSRWSRSPGCATDSERPTRHTSSRSRGGFRPAGLPELRRTTGGRVFALAPGRTAGENHRVPSTPAPVRPVPQPSHNRSANTLDRTSRTETRAIIPARSTNHADALTPRPPRGPGV
jgi:hypothetical protein